MSTREPVLGATLFALCFSTVCHAQADPGYTFSISASPTDPEVLISPPLGAVGELYLWLVCAAPNASAVEFGFDGSLSVAGFTPMNGVFNIGQGTDLLLAIPGCQGGIVNFVLGKWFVLNDSSGGTLHLGPSSGGGFVAVSCEGDATVDPLCYGFTSVPNDTPVITGTYGCWHIGGGPVASESQSWGRLKSLYQ
jgi:hypothetical protein